MAKPVSELQTASDFREFFAEIPDEKWARFNYVNQSGQKCAGGHLGCVSGKFETIARQAFNRLDSISIKATEGSSVVFVNDYANESHPQSTPKARILAMLDDAIAKGL